MCFSQAATKRKASDLSYRQSDFKRHAGEGEEFEDINSRNWRPELDQKEVMYVILKIRDPLEQFPMQPPTRYVRSNKK